MIVDPIVAAYEERLPERALDDLADRLERPEAYPREYDRTRQITRRVILSEYDQELVAEALEAYLRDKDCIPSLNNRIWAMMRDYLRDTDWHTRRTAELRNEDAENAEEAEADRKREGEA